MSAYCTMSENNKKAYYDFLGINAFYITNKAIDEVSNFINCFIANEGIDALEMLSIILYQ